VLVVIPNPLLGTRGVATCPVSILLVALAAWLAAALGKAAIIPIGRARKEFHTIPDLVWGVLPLALINVPNPVRGACLVATCPMLVLFEAGTAAIRATARVHAIFTVGCARDLVTIPYLVVLLLESLLLENPHFVLGARFIAT